MDEIHHFIILLLMIEDLLKEIALSLRLILYCALLFFALPLYVSLGLT